MVKDTDFPDEDTTPNTTGVIETLEIGRIEEIETILGPAFRLPRAGVIRPGIKILKNGCTTQDQKLYEELVKQGLDWDEIDQRLGKDAGGKSKLIPHNVDYFTIRPEDCQNPQNVETIYKLYADPDGKLRSFPVWFATNEWWNIIPHSLRCFGKQQGLRFVSFFKGPERWCKFPAPTNSKQRVFGGRVWGERPCEPNTCIEFQSGECKFGGVIQCYIPGTKGIGIWIIPTISWRSLVSIKSSLEAFAKLTGGRISGLFNLPDKDGRITPQAIFIISKKKEVVYPEDGSGEPKRHEQWIINLDVDFDLSEIVKWAAEQKVLSRGHIAAQVLNGVKDAGNISVPEDNHERTELSDTPLPEVTEETPSIAEEEETDAYQNFLRMIGDSESPAEVDANYFIIKESEEYHMLSAEETDKLKAYADYLKSKLRKEEKQQQETPENIYRRCIQTLENSDSIAMLQKNYLQIKNSEEFHELPPEWQSKIRVHTNNLKKTLERSTETPDKETNQQPSWQ